MEPNRAEEELLRLAEQLAEFGLRIFSVASTLDERIFAACAKAKVPLIRVMVDIGAEGYMESVKRARDYLQSQVPHCEWYGVKIGVQQHYGDCVSNSMGLRHLLEGFDPRHVGAVWDAAHDGLAGVEPRHGIDIVWSHLLMVNLKNAYYVRTNGPEAERAAWKRYFTTGPQGLSSWPDVAHELQTRGYEGVVCLTAEYNDEARVNELIRQDIQYAKSLWD